MATKPKLTVSGYRGIWGESLDEKITFEFGLAFARVIKNCAENKNNGGKLKILIGQDARKTGSLMVRAFSRALEKEGLEIDYVGIIPTPSILLLVKKLSYAGGIIITASHNPIEYNGFKFVTREGLFFDQDKIDEVKKIRDNLNAEEKEYTNNINESSFEPLLDNSKFREIHINEVLKNVDVDLIKKNKFKVTLDPINSAGSIITQELLSQFDCEVNVINVEQNGEFAHEAEPLAKNLSQIGNAVIANKSDIGFAQDPDADRLVIVNEKGETLSEEYTIALAVKNVLSKNPSDVVVNMSTSRVCEDIANSFGKKLFRCKIGELNVVNKMIEIRAEIGGEGNGGVIYPKINMARDSLVGIALILELISKENKTISELAKDLPQYLVRKEKVTFDGNMDILYMELKKELSDANSVDMLDGIRFDWSDFSWIHIRRSNTEPKMWIISEAKDEAQIDYLFEKVKLIINNIK